MRLQLDLDNGTSASAAAVQITTAGEDDGKVPLGRVGTYLFVKGTASLVFEAGLPDGSGEIWSMNKDGGGASFVAKGRKPQELADGSLAILAPSSSVQILSSAEVAR